ncbi:MAG: hypothetical protein LBV58_02370 [Acholeplasmatales bacterium]|nr:hypothetical protein [Acholeplasmatales bacterium]
MSINLIDLVKENLIAFVDELRNKLYSRKSVLYFNRNSKPCKIVGKYKYININFENVENLEILGGGGVKSTTSTIL